jgi:hypothetical protein
VEEEMSKATRTKTPVVAPSAVELAEDAMATARTAKQEQEAALATTRLKLTGMEDDRRRAVLGGDQALSANLRDTITALAAEAEDTEKVILPTMRKRVEDCRAALTKAAIVAMDEMLVDLDAQTAAALAAFMATPRAEEAHTAARLYREAYSLGHDLLSVTSAMKHRRTWSVGLFRRFAEVDPALRLAKPVVGQPWERLLRLARGEEGAAA